MRPIPIRRVSVIERYYRYDDPFEKMVVKNSRNFLELKGKTVSGRTRHPPSATCCFLSWPRQSKSKTCDSTLGLSLAGEVALAEQWLVEGMGEPLRPFPSGPCGADSQPPRLENARHRRAVHARHVVVGHGARSSRLSHRHDQR